MSVPKITAIIPTFKRPQLLKRAIESILKQTYSEFQICVYDNASNDETAEVVLALQKTDSRIKYHCHPENIGMIGNYAYALSQVQTPFFSILSDDDLALPTFFETALEGFNRHPDAMFSAGSTIVVSKKEGIVDDAVESWPREGYFTPDDGSVLMIGRWIPPQGIVLRSDVIRQIPIATSNPVAWDCDFLLQIAARHPIFISKKACAIFLRHDDSFSSQQSGKRWREAFGKMIERMAEERAIPEERRTLLLKHLSLYLKRYNYHSIRHSVVIKQFSEAESEFDVYRKNYRLNFKVVLFFLIAKACCHFPFIHLFLLRMKKLKRFLRLRKHKNKHEGILDLMFSEN